MYNVDCVKTCQVNPWQIKLPVVTSSIRFRIFLPVLPVIMWRENLCCIFTGTSVIASINSLLPALVTYALHVPFYFLFHMLLQIVWLCRHAFQHFQ